MERVSPFQRQAIDTVSYLRRQAIDTVCPLKNGVCVFHNIIISRFSSTNQEATHTTKRKNEPISPIHSKRISSSIEIISIRYESTDNTSPHLHIIIIIIIRKSGRTQIYRFQNVDGRRRGYVLFFSLSLSLSKI